MSPVAPNHDQIASRSPCRPSSLGPHNDDRRKPSQFGGLDRPSCVRVPGRRLAGSLGCGPCRLLLRGLGWSLGRRVPAGAAREHDAGHARHADPKARPFHPEDCNDTHDIRTMSPDSPCDNHRRRRRGCRSTFGANAKGSAERRSASGSSPHGDFSARGRGGKMRNDGGTAEWDGDLPVFGYRWIDHARQGAAG